MAKTELPEMRRQRESHTPRPAQNPVGQDQRSISAVDVEEFRRLMNDGSRFIRYGHYINEPQTPDSLPVITRSQNEYGLLPWEAWPDDQKSEPVHNFPDGDRVENGMRYIKPKRRHDEKAGQ